MRAPLALAAFFLLISSAASAASGTDVCTEFLTEHLGDPAWEQQCLAWLKQPPPSPFFSSQASGSGSAMAMSGPGADPSIHVSASDLLLAQGNQNEAFLAVDPSDPQRIFYAAMTAPFSNGLFAAHSTDGGASWAPTTIAVGPGAPIPAGAGDPWAVWSDTGKLFLSYLKDPSIDEFLTFGIPLGARPTIVAMSGDGGASFVFVEALDAPTASTDRGSMATGPGGAFGEGSLWTIFRHQNAGTIAVAGAALDAAGSPVLDSCGAGTGFFCNLQVIAAPSGDFLFPGHVAVGPSGQVLATFFRKLGIPSAPMDVFVAIDPDGLGPEPFAEPPGVNPVLLTNIEFAEKIKPHMSRGVLPLANLAWDLTTGRVYLVSTREMPNGSGETDILLLHSDDDGATWSAPRTVNKDISPLGEVRGQFFPHVAVDQTTGLVAVAWHDPRNDDGGADGIPNTETQVYAAISADGGNYFHELPVSSGVSRASGLPTDIATSHGDYLGVAFQDGNIHVGWVDNSNSAGDNPDAGSPPGCDPFVCMDAYTARIPLPEPESDASMLVGSVLLFGLALRRRACARRRAHPSQGAAAV